MLLFYTKILLLFYIGMTNTSIHGDVEKSVYNILRRNYHNGHINQIEPELQSSQPLYLKEKNDKISDTKQAKRKARILQKARTKILWTKLKDPKIGNAYYMDPVLNQIRRNNREYQLKARRYVESSDSSSSSNEMNQWKEEVNDQWLKKKIEALNSTNKRGDVVNMVAARPWGVPCGDPNQHDIPWGTCMLAIECDTEYRIYRGDSFCGKTRFVCCALQVSNYDMNQGFDLSFADTSFSTDSAERKNRERGSKEINKRHKERAKKKRLKERRRRKRQLKKNIRRIIHEIRKILNRSFRNATHHRQHRTLLLKKYIRDLKKQYRKDRKAVRDIHVNDMEHVDNVLLKKLDQIKDLNKNFLTNSTFRDIVVNGTMSKTGARMLAQAYPELKSYLQGKLRRDGGGLEGIETNEHNDYLEYDIEYGALYY